MEKTRLPPAIYILGLAIFAQGTSELMLSGLLPHIADDLAVSIPDAGMLTSGFAIGMLVGAPVLAVVTLRWERRRTLLLFLAVFAITHLIGALAPGYQLLMISRVIGAVAYAGFWAVATVTALSLVPANAKGKAMSIVAGGLTVATIVGVPAGAMLGQQFGWRAAFWTVAALSALSAIGVMATIPGGRAASAPRLRPELKVMSQPRLWVTYVATAMSSGSVMATFTYLGALLIGDTGIPAGWVPGVLVLFGLGSLLGITIGGRVADARPFTTLYIGFGGVMVAALSLGFAATVPVAVVALAVLMGAFGFATNPAVNVVVFSMAGNAPTLAGAFNVSGFNIGISVGPWLGGLLIGGGFGLAAVTWVSAALAAIGIAAIAGSAAMRAKPATPAVAEPAVASV